MDHVGMDLGKRESQIAILTEDGELRDLRIRTEHHRLVEVFGPRPRAKILVEASTESEWVARCLEELGHEVIVADPNYAPMYAHRTRRVKTDRRDARALAHACRLGAYRPAHRTSTQRRHLRTHVAVREALVRTRAAWIGRIQPLLRREGFRVRTGAPETFTRRVEEVALPPALKTVITPLLQLLGPINEQIDALDEEFERIVAADDVARRLAIVPGVGPVTAVAFIATVDDVGRPERSSSRSLSRVGPLRVELERDPAPGPDHQGGQ
jgi:transposase